MDFKKLIINEINSDCIGAEELNTLLVENTDKEMGDYALPCFKLAKQLRKSPVAIAEDICSSTATDGFIKEVRAVNGYVNFFIDDKKLCEDVIDEVASEGEDYGRSNQGKGKTVCVEYSSVNIAKPFHIGHLGTTAIGSALYKIYDFLGYNMVGINHLGDWGTQFGRMIVAYKLWGNKDEVDREGVKALAKYYTRFHVEVENHTELADEAREWFKRIEQGDAEATALFNYFKEITLKDVGEVYDRLNVKFDSWLGESFYSDKIPAVLEDLRAKHLTKISDGAELVDLSDYNMPPCLIVKQDGATLYATRDIAAAHYRKETYNFFKLLYVVAYQQNLHFKQFFKVLELEGCDWVKDMVHVSYGMVSLADGAMSTRKGNVVWLVDVLDKAVEKAKSIIDEKNPSLPDKDEVAEAVGVGAVIFSAVSNARIKDIVFSFDRVLSFDGETSPYLQYTHARCCSLFEKAQTAYDGITPDYSSVNNASAKELAIAINSFPAVIDDAAQKYEPCIISKYLIDVAQLFNRFYMDNRIITENAAQTKARLQLVKCTKIVLSNGLKLLGICPVEKM
ncbi:MAG: arginine--tRNA ligase [Clostridia bacterium]|nr:arginine--tRNA ligase [Clostridia bacterium]